MMFIYYCMFYFATFNQIRQMIAVGLTFWAFLFVQDKHYLKYCLIVVLAALFHVSALASIAILPISVLLNQQEKKLTIRQMLMLIASAVCVLFVAMYIPTNSMINNRLQLYSAMNIEDKGIMAYFYLIAIMVIFGLKKLIQVSYKMKSEPLDLYSVIYVFLGVIATVFSYKYQYFSRITTQFAIFAILFYTKREKIKIISDCKHLAGGVFAMYSLISVVAAGGYGIMPYAALLH